MTNDEIWARAVHAWSVGARELERLAGGVDRGVFVEMVKRIAECPGRIVTAGVGTSAATAKKIAHTLSCVERPSFFLSPGDAVHGALGAAQPGDTAILISKGGGTREIMNIVPALREKGIFIIGVTEREDSPLASASDLVMKIKVEREADAFDMLATTSAMAVVAVFDAAAIAIMTYTGYTRDQFAVIHPGGAVGDRLLAKKG